MLNNLYVDASSMDFQSNITSHQLVNHFGGKGDGGVSLSYSFQGKKKIMG